MTPVEEKFQDYFGEAFQGNEELEEQFRKVFFTGALAIMAIIESSNDVSDYEKSILLTDMNAELSAFFNVEQGETVNG